MAQPTSGTSMRAARLCQWLWFLLLLPLHLIKFLSDLTVTASFFLVCKRQRKVLPPITDPLLLVPAHTLALKIRQRQMTSEAVVRAYISRIQEVNPILNAIVDQRFEAALDEAKDVDRIIAKGGRTMEEMEIDTPFLGVPFTAKESLEVSGMHLTMGLVVRKDIVSMNDADAVRLMRQAGAIILGVTNVPELCCTWDTYNNVYGRTRNPYDIRWSVAGSSGGEGSILAAAGSVIGVGADVGGSIRMPALFNGIFGHKPTWGIVSNKGGHPELTGEPSRFLATGPMCRYASDLRPFFKVLAGPNLHKLKLDDKVDFNSLKIYYTEDDMNCVFVSRVERKIWKTQREVIEYFHQTYGIQAEKVFFPKLSWSLAMCLTLFGGTLEHSVSQELADRQGEVSIMWQLLKCLVCRSVHTLSALMIGLIATTSRCLAPILHNSMNAKCNALRIEMGKLLGSNGVFLYPTHPTLVVYKNQPFFQMSNFAYSGIFNLLGLPSTHCALGLGHNGKPLGLQVVAAHYNDHLCLAMAEELERAFGGWTRPCFSSYATL